MPSFNRPLSVAEAAEKTGRAGRTIRYAIKAGHLKAEKLPGSTGAWLIQERDLDKWAEVTTPTASA